MKINRKWCYTPYGRVCVYQYADDSDVSYMSSLFVDKPQRGNGYGKKLVDWALLHCKGKKLILKCKQKLVTFYEKMGFKIYLRDPTDDEIWMIHYMK